MENQAPVLGFVSLVRPTFDTALAGQITQRMRAQLTGAGFTLVEAAQVISTADQARQAAQALAGHDLDLLFVFQASFADSMPVMTLAEAVDAPIVLWAVPESPAGERLRLNALCGITLAAHALTRAGLRYTAVYAPPDDPASLGKVRSVALAGRVRRRLRAARIGLVGEAPPGFVSCQADQAALKRRFGVDVVPFALGDVFEKMRAVEPSAIDAVYAAWRSQIDGMDTLDQAAVRAALAAYCALRDLARQHRLDGLAVRCWFQFIEEMGCAVCGAECMLTNELLPASCEADVNGAITLLILQWLSGGPAFDSDIVSFDRQADTAVFWHCGKAPLAMADPAAAPRAVDHFNFKKPLALEFPLKPGRVTLARLSEATGDYRLVVGSGEVLQAPISFSGTSGVVRFDRPASEVLETILGEGLEHHIALVYGDHVESLLALAGMLALPVLRLA